MELLLVLVAVSFAVGAIVEIDVTFNKSILIDLFSPSASSLHSAVLYFASCIVYILVERYLVVRSIIMVAIVTVLA